MQDVREILGVLFLAQIMSSESALHYVGIPNLSSYNSSPLLTTCSEPAREQLRCPQLDVTVVFVLKTRTDPTCTCLSVNRMLKHCIVCTGPIPSSWGKEAFPTLQNLGLGSNQINGALPESFPRALQLLDLSSNQLTGVLLSNWPLGLQFLYLEGNAMNGTLPAELGSLTQLQGLQLAGNAFSGELPSQWGAPGAFESLWFLQCDNMKLTGTLPSSWGSPDAFQQLELLIIDTNGLTGDLPESWASEGAFPRLICLYLNGCALEGTIPPSWGSQHAYPAMQTLYLDNNPLHGSLPAFNNAALGVVRLDNCSILSGLDTFWTSSAPLLMAALQNNSISGHLVDRPASLNQLAFLDLSENSLTGTVPLSWLQGGSMLSHVSYLDVGRVWQQSINLNSWRQQLCLKTDLYDVDVIGQQLAVLPELLQRLGGASDAIGQRTWLQSGRGYSSALLLGGLDPAQHIFANNQLISVADICANHDANQLLLIVWLVFGGCCLLLIGLYVLGHWHTNRPGSKQSKIWSCQMPGLPMLSVLYKITWPFGGLAFYYYDLVTNIVLLAQVWGTWPAAALVAIFLFHFAVVGTIVAFHGLRKLFAVRYDLADTGVTKVCYTMAVVTMSLAVGPCLIPLVLVLDTCVFIRQVSLCIKHVVRWPRFYWMRPGYLVAFRCTGCLHGMRYFGFKWVNLENYESMHNLIAAVLQSLPTVVLNSVIFSLGNKPSHGIFLSSGLFVTAIVASCLAMLKCLVVVLWQAYRGKVHPMQHAATLIVGTTLAGSRVSSTGQNSTVELLIQQYHASGSAPLGAPEQP